MTYLKRQLEEYMQTPEGRKVTHIFENFSLYVREKKRTLFKFLTDSGITIQTSMEFFSRPEHWKILKNAAPRKKGFDPENDAEKSLLCNLEECDPKEKRRRVAKVPLFSLKWFICDNENAFPYLFIENFKTFLKICQEFDIEIPEYKANPTDIEKRVDFYFIINDILKAFREKHNMSPIELCVFIYGFAIQNVVEPCDVSSELTAHNAFFTIAYDNELNDMPKNKLFTWCVPNSMKSGDIAFMYEGGSEQCIRYIVQARTDAFRDPFEWWGLYSVHVVLLSKCPRISLEELRNNRTLKSIFNSSSKLRGPAGNEFSKKEYEALLQILEEKGFPVSQLPKIIWAD